MSNMTAAIWNQTDWDLQMYSYMFILAYSELCMLQLWIVINAVSSKQETTAFGWGVSQIKMDFLPKPVAVQLNVMWQKGSISAACLKARDTVHVLFPIIKMLKSYLVDTAQALHQSPLCHHLVEIIWLNENAIKQHTFECLKLLNEDNC